MPKSVRVRFAPSPTGYLHLGGLRSALFNFLYARHNHGTFILRIEDTDQQRLVSDAAGHLQDSLAWLGLTPDEGPGHPNPQFGPYLQSERLELYSKYAEELLNNSLAYKDFTPPERLEELRGQAQKDKKPFRFTREIARLEPARKGDKHVIRFQVQPGPQVTWRDAVWGEQIWERGVLDDFVAIKSDGYPTYNFASVVDDHLMEISHVFRGAEFLSSTPKNLLIYEALGWKPPEYVHLPAVLGHDKAKLSKRHGAKSALEYRDAGYLPEAVINYLASLGFNDGTTKEIFTLEELIKAFSLKRIQSSPATFDPERLEWMNGVYIRQMPLRELDKRLKGYWPDSSSDFDDGYRHKVLGLVQDRLRLLAELPELTDFFFSDPEPSADLLTKQVEPTKAKELLVAAQTSLLESDFSESDLEKRLRGLVEESGMKTGQLFGLIRVAVTGKTAAPGLFETLSLLGKEATQRRLKAATHVLE